MSSHVDTKHFTNALECLTFVEKSKNVDETLSIRIEKYTELAGSVGVEEEFNFEENDSNSIKYLKCCVHLMSQLEDVIKNSPVTFTVNTGPVRSRRKLNPAPPPIFSLNTEKYLVMIFKTILMGILEFSADPGKYNFINKAITILNKIQTHENVEVYRYFYQLIPMWFYVLITLSVIQQTKMIEKTSSETPKPNLIADSPDNLINFVNNVQLSSTHRQVVEPINYRELFHSKLDQFDITDLIEIIGEVLTFSPPEGTVLRKEIQPTPSHHVTSRQPNDNEKKGANTTQQGNSSLICTEKESQVVQFSPREKKRVFLQVMQYCGNLLSELIIRKGAVQGMIYYFMAINEDEDKVKKVCQKVICKCPKSLSITEYYANISLQILPQLFSECSEKTNKEIINNFSLYKNVIWKLTSSFLIENLQLGREFFLFPRTKPFLLFLNNFSESESLFENNQQKMNEYLANMQKNYLDKMKDNKIVIDEKEMKETVEFLWNILNNEKNSQTVYKSVTPLIPAVFQLYCFTEKSVSHLKTLVREILEIYYKFYEDSNLIFKNIILPSINPGNEDSTFFSFSAGDGGGITITKSTQKFVFILNLLIIIIFLLNFSPHFTLFFSKPKPTQLSMGSCLFDQTD